MTEAADTTPPKPDDERYRNETPAMRHYLTLRDQHPGVMLLYRIGDFYETFYDDAVKINKLLGLTLTSRSKDKAVPMAGVPASTLEQYLARLVRLGVSVAICEQIGDPAETKGTMERRITRIVTPGTLTDNALLSEKSDSVLLAVSAAKGAKGSYALVWLTLTNGSFRATMATEATLAAELARIAPSEILAADALTEALKTIAPSVSVHAMPAWYFDAARGRELLKKKFALNNLEAWGVEEKPQLLPAVNALLSYVDNTQCDNPPYIAPLVIEDESEFLGLDAASRRNLEITESLRPEGGPTLFSTMDTCLTSMGSRLMKRWLTSPRRDPRIAQSRHAAVEEFLLNPDLTKPLEKLLDAVPDIERTAGRIALKSIRPKEAAALRDVLPQLKAVGALAAQLKSPIIEPIAAALHLSDDLQRKLADTLLDDPATFLREGDVIRSEADAELSDLRNLRDNTSGLLIEMEAREKARTGIATLKVAYNRVSGFYIEVPKGQAENVPVDYKRRQTLKNNERFITPELKEYEDRAFSAKERCAQIEKRLWDELVDFLGGWVETIIAASRAVAALDVLTSFARHAFDMRWVSPKMTTKPGLAIQGARHPVVEKMITDFIPNNCRFSPGRRLLIITGPNMGGKSTYMRSVALIVLLAYVGSFVPAVAAEIGPIDRILTRIGASDDLARGRSTFMVEMTEAASILRQATSESLVLMDEIGRGTSTFDGLSLAASIAEELASTARSWTLFATHYFELTQLQATCPEVVNVHVSAKNDAGGIVFLHDVKEGPANQSYGIAVAKLAGVPERVIRRAKRLLSQLEEQRSVTAAAQPDLFNAPAPAEESAPAPAAAADPRLEESAQLAQALAALEADDLTPREALKKLYELKDAAGAIWKNHYQNQS